MAYHQLTPDERYTIASMRSAGRRPAEIARVLGRHRSTIGREIARNLCKTDGYYRPSKAQTRTLTRRTEARRVLHHSAQQYGVVEALLREKWSPEQVAGTMEMSFGFRISHQTIYRYVRQDRCRGGSLFRLLRQSGKLRRKRHNSVDFRGKLPGRRSIEDRPVEVERREAIGHWEVDTVMGTDRNCIVTLVERATRFTLIGKLRARTKAELNRRIVKLIRQRPEQFKTVTADNGTEFHGYKQIEAATGVTFYFAHPYHSWERGTNENTNGLIRQYLPKGTSMASLTQQQCNAIARSLNTRPRKRLGFHTPESRFNA